MNKKKYTQIITKESEILTFGKYKYQTIQHILRNDPSYIIWLHEKEIVQFPVGITELAYDKLLDDFQQEMDSHGHNYSRYYDDEY